MLTTNSHPKIYLLSDTHLIADELHDNGAAFQKMRDTSAGKDLDYQEIMLTAFVRKVLNDKPDAVIITGDLTFNGARRSGEKLTEIFAPLKRVGISFLPIPGNHDINDGWAREFEGEFQYRVSQITPQDWKELFARSYQVAADKDTHSLSYSVNLNNDYRLILADSNLYPETFSKTHPTTNGYLSPSRLAWIEKELQEARKHHQHILFFMHHNLYDHNAIINDSFTLDNASELQDLFRKYNVRATFSGHIHAQNIISAKTDCPSFDVASSCFSMCDQGYGVISLTSKELNYQHCSFDCTAFLTPEEMQQLPPCNFHDYLRHQFSKVNQLQMDKYQAKFDSKSDWQAATNLVNNLNWDFFTGKSNYDAVNKEEIKTSPAYQLLQQKLPMMINYADSLLSVSTNSQHINIKW
ncbi:metallophosphoesterase [Lactobacillus intestinalis]|uniref:Metallophosphoesterase n=2 Tax=Lactobacillus intestinalis TaxID=151781 RepID=A0A4S2BPD7_9LACO|nr:metallophosphoesterase [Lactobacillus intestinalis]KAI4315890.1 3',5'-cyclic adenosine monophosphate phosphodiesterase CpdA [Lactobacillus intestinalis]TGY16531.1 metallophosphoesterase [Lactobacillus intestinalis]